MRLWGCFLTLVFAINTITLQADSTGGRSESGPMTPKHGLRLGFNGGPNLDYICQKDNWAWYVGLSGAGTEEILINGGAYEGGYFIMGEEIGVRWKLAELGSRVAIHLGPMLGSTQTFSSFWPRSGPPAMSYMSVELGLYTKLDAELFVTDSHDLALSYGYHFGLAHSASFNGDQVRLGGTPSDSRWIWRYSLGSQVIGINYYW